MPEDKKLPPLPDPTQSGVDRRVDDPKGAVGPVVKVNPEEVLPQTPEESAADAATPPYTPPASGERRQHRKT